MPNTKVGILLTDAANQEQIAIIEFNPSGVLVFHVIRKGLHVFALKPVERLLSKHVLQEPLYVKYESVLEKQSELPAAILEQEATACTDTLNQLEPSVTVGAHTVKARMVHYSE